MRVRIRVCLQAYRKQFKLVTASEVAEKVENLWITVEERPFRAA